MTDCIMGSLVEIQVLRRWDTGELHSVISDLVRLATDIKHWLILGYPHHWIPFGCGQTVHNRCVFMERCQRNGIYRKVWFSAEAFPWYLQRKHLFLHKKIKNLETSRLKSLKSLISPTNNQSTPVKLTSKHDRKAGGDCTVRTWLITHLQRLILWISCSHDVRKWSCWAFASTVWWSTARSHALSPKITGDGSKNDFISGVARSH